MIEECESMAEGILSELDATAYRTVCCVEERGARRIRRKWESMRRHVEDRGRRAVLLDGDDGQGLYEFLSQWGHGKGDDEQIQRLFDYLTMAMDMGCREVEAGEREELIVDAVVRLVERLVAQRDALVVVLRPRKLSKLDRRVLQEVMRHFLADPLADIDPLAVKSSPLGFVWEGTPEELEGVRAKAQHSTDDGLEKVRRFLRQESVVEQLLNTTQGDQKRLEALFGALPDTVTHLWARRIAELEPRERSVAEYLAVADKPLEVGFLDRLVEDSAVDVVRKLCDQGIVTRSMKGGLAKVALASSEIQRGIAAGLGEEKRREIHALLATKAVRRGGEDGIFVARHALAAGDTVTGVQFGVPAARGLLRRGRWERADELLAKLRTIEDISVEQRRQILTSSLRLAEAKSAWCEALSLAGELKKIAQDDSEKLRIRSRRATYLMKIGRVDAAEEVFRQILDHREGKSGESLATEAMLGLAEICYQRGEHEGVSRWSLRAMEELAQSEMASHREEQLKVKCDSLQGKAALYRAELEEAQKFFERASGRARQMGLCDEESRAEVNLGVVAVQRRRYDEACRRLRQALEKAEMAQGTLRLNCWLNLGIVHQRRGKFSEALDYYSRALREASRRRDEVASDVALHNLATLYQDMGAFDAAGRLIAEMEADGDVAKEKGFASRWATMTSAQILLKQENYQQAIDALRRAERHLTQEQRLYGHEMCLRRALAYVKVNQLDEAASLRDELRQEESSQSPQFQCLYRYLEAALARRRGRAPEESTWRAIIDDLESLGMFQDAAEVRMELVSQMEAQAGGPTEASTWIIERGIEDLRQRAKSVPERFYENYLSIPIHRQMLAKYHETKQGALPEEVKALVRCVEKRAMNEEVEAPEVRQHDETAYRRWRARYGDIIGEDPQILNVFRVIDRVAPSKTTVLLAGESGTGKELVAEAIHEKSHRSDKPFVRVNCAAFVEELLLSELFGHEKGAFTGAVEARAGRFERADGGTIFLDEIGDISAKTQVALLRVLQQGTFERVGGTEKHEVDVRVVAATNRDLEKMVQEGTFRLDLYYRLKGFLIEIPPLRERREDIPRLLHHFAGQFSQGDEVPRFSDEVVQFLAQYRWPGNVRELENFVRSVLLFSEDDCIELEQLAQFREFFSDQDIDASLPPVDTSVDVEEFEAAVEPTQIVTGTPEDALVEEVIADERSLSRLKKRLEKKCIKAALRQTGGNITQAARILQMKRPRLSQIVNGDDELVALKEELVG